MLCCKINLIYFFMFTYEILITKYQFSTNTFKQRILEHVRFFFLQKFKRHFEIILQNQLRNCKIACHGQRHFI